MCVVCKRVFCIYVVLLSCFMSVFWSTIVFASADPSPVTVTFDYATENAISISWNKDSRAQSYIVWVKSNIQYPSWTSVQKTTSTSYVLNDCVVKDVYQFKVAAHGVAATSMSEPIRNCTVFNTESVSIRVKKYNSEKGTVHVEATATGEIDSYLWQYKTLSENEYTIKSSIKPYITVTVPDKAAVYEIKCTGVRKLANGTQYMTKESSVKYVPDASFTVKHKSGLKLRVKLTPVKGATGYIVQVRAKTSSKWSTVATLKATAKRATITKYKGKEFVKYKNYYVRVKTVYNSLKSSGKMKKKVRFTSNR